MVTVGVGPHVALDVDVPILDGLEDESELVGVVVLLGELLTTVAEGLGLHTADQVAVRVVNRNVRPTTGDVVHEQTALVGQVGRTGVVLAHELVRVVQAGPVCELGADLGIDRVAVHLVLSELEQTVLVHEGSADAVVDAVVSSTHAEVVVVGGNVLSVMLFEPVGVGVTVGVGTPATVALRNGSRGDLTGYVVVDPLESLRAEVGGGTVVGPRAVPIAGELVGTHHLREMEGAVEQHVTCVGDVGLAGLSSLGGDEDHTESGPRSVDGG